MILVQCYNNTVINNNKNMEQKLTAKQKNILEYIRELTMQNGEKPTSYRLHK